MYINRLLSSLPKDGKEKPDIVFPWDCEKDTTARIGNRRATAQSSFFEPTMIITPQNETTVEQRDWLFVTNDERHSWSSIKTEKMKVPLIQANDNWQSKGQFVLMYRISKHEGYDYDISFKAFVLKVKI